MACFVVPLVEAIAVSALRKTHSDKTNLPTLEKMLWGGSIMLIIDHVLNGELTWQFPFFTALAQEGGGAVMLREMLTVGVPMAAVVTLAWAALVLLQKRKTVTSTTN
ncbi:MAG: hypothetical protein IKS47_01415 [Bacteroidales bacterium]|nr:hypothetical protein [Bacteroidales bacterium]